MGGVNQLAKTLLSLIRRDLQKILNLRTILVWGAISALGVFFFFTTSGKFNLTENNEVDFMALFLPQIIFGAWAVLSIYFDLVSSDRQNNVLDCILSSGVTKPMVFCSKIISLIAVSLMLSILYLIPISIVIVYLSGALTHLTEVVKYLLPLWGYIMVYAAIGTVISVAARSTKTSLIVSLSAGLILMPRIFILIIDGISSLFGWTQVTKDALSLIAPGVMMERLAHSGTAEYAKTFTLFASSIIVLLTISLFIFCRQDELNYGGHCKVNMKD